VIHSKNKKKPEVAHREIKNQKLKMKKEGFTQIREAACGWREAAKKKQRGIRANQIQQVIFAPLRFLCLCVKLSWALRETSNVFEQ
jgi:hypothetical protein